MQALTNVRMQEASVFGKWCIKRNVRAMLASPMHVAAFIRDCEPMLTIEKIWQAVSEIAESHISNGFADPTAGGLAAAAMNDIAKIDPPRSWPKPLWGRFLALPYDLQLYIDKRSRETDTAVRRAQTEAATARQALAAIEQPAEQESNGIKSTAIA